MAAPPPLTPQSMPTLHTEPGRTPADQANRPGSPASVTSDRGVALRSSPDRSALLVAALEMAARCSPCHGAGWWQPLPVQAAVRCALFGFPSRGTGRFGSAHRSARRPYGPGPPPPRNVLAARPSRHGSGSTSTTRNQPPQKGTAIMATANTITIAGNLTRDPELRFTPNGRATASFSVAVNNDWTDPSTGERRESTDFFDVVVWGKPAENAAQSLSKGQEVVVSGRLQQRSWETDEGERRSRIELTATVVGAGLSFGTTVFTKNPRPGEAAA